MATATSARVSSSRHTVLWGAPVPVTGSCWQSDSYVTRHGGLHPWPPHLMPLSHAGSQGGVAGASEVLSRGAGASSASPHALLGVMVSPGVWGGACPPARGLRQSTQWAGGAVSQTLSCLSLPLAGAWGGLWGARDGKWGAGGGVVYSHGACFLPPASGEAVSNLLVKPDEPSWSGFLPGSASPRRHVPPVSPQARRDADSHRHLPGTEHPPPPRSRNGSGS